MKKLFALLLVLCAVNLYVLPAVAESKNELLIIHQVEGGVTLDKDEKVVPEVLGVVSNLALAVVPVGTNPMVFSSDGLFQGLGVSPSVCGVLRIKSFPKDTIFAFSVNDTVEHRPVTTLSIHSLESGQEELLMPMVGGDISFTLQIPGVESIMYFTSDGVFELDNLAAARPQITGKEAPDLTFSSMSWATLWPNITFASPEAEKTAREYFAALGIEIPDAVEVSSI